MATFEEKEIELERQVRLYLSNPHNVEVAAEEVLNDLIDTVILGIVFDVHRAAKIGLVDVEDGVGDEVSKFELVEAPDVDIFGQQRVKKPQKCECPCCKLSFATLRFASHLGRCMGIESMSRNSSRIASLRIANNSKESVGYSGMMSDEDDSELNVGSDKRRKKKDRNGSRRSKNQKTGRNGDVAMESATCSDLSSSNTNYDSMTNDEKKNLLMHMCGVISVNTKKLCTRSKRCPQHTDEQRRAVRTTLLNPQATEIPCTSDMLQVDVDTYDDDGQNLRESLSQSWEQEHSNTSSPADSASTSSSSSKKREKISKKSKSSSKNHKGSPNFVICSQE